MTDIYKHWSKKRLKSEIFLLKKTYNELFDSYVNLKKENEELKAQIEKNEEFYIL